MSKYQIASPLKSLQNINGDDKYSFGKTFNKINEIKSKKPVFAFDFISIKATNFCFDSRFSALKDYHKLFKSLKEISVLSYDEISKNDALHFHEVDFKDTTISQTDFIKCIVLDAQKVDHDHCPTVYQFKAFQEARILGFISDNVFYMVYFDRNHNAYKRK